MHPQFKSHLLSTDKTLNFQLISQFFKRGRGYWRRYFNTYQVQSKNLIDRQLLRIFHSFATFCRGIELKCKKFPTQLMSWKIPPHKWCSMDQTLQFSSFLKLRHFIWKSITTYKLEFKVLFSNRPLCQTFSFTDKIVV